MNHVKVKSQAHFVASFVFKVKYVNEKEDAKEKVSRSSLVKS